MTAVCKVRCFESCLYKIMIIPWSLEYSHDKNYTTFYLFTLSLNLKVNSTVVYKRILYLLTNIFHQTFLCSVTELRELGESRPAHCAKVLSFVSFCKRLLIYFPFLLLRGTGGSKQNSNTLNLLSTKQFISLKVKQ